MEIEGLSLKANIHRTYCPESIGSCTECQNEMATLKQIRAAIFNPQILVQSDKAGSNQFKENLLVDNHWLDDRNVFLHRVCSDERLKLVLAVLEEIGN